MLKLKREMIIRTDSSNNDFRNLVRELDKDLAIRDGDEHSFYAQYNKIDKIQYAVVCYIENLPVACGAIKEFQTGVMEVKRMYVIPSMRNKGIAVQVLEKLELWAKELGNYKCILETGKKQPEAIRLYQKSGYSMISNYGQYEGVENSICFEKIL